MKDRVVQHPGRYQLVPVAGTTDQFDLVAVPGTITEAGTDLDVANLLSDTTAAALAAALGIAAPTTPNEAFAGLATPPVYEKLLEVTVSTAATSISLDLSGIDMTLYSSVEVLAEISTVSATTISMTLNNASDTNRYIGASIGITTSVSAINGVNFGALSTDAGSGSTSPIRLNIQTPHKGSSYGYIEIEFSGGKQSSPKMGHCGTYANAALSSIQFFAASGNIMVGSKFYVYGVRK